MQVCRYEPHVRPRGEEKIAIRNGFIMPPFFKGGIAHRLFSETIYGGLKAKQSFSNPGTPLDNAVAESFFSCMKREELSHSYYDTIEELQRDIGEYVDFLQYATTSAIRNANSE